MSVRYDCVALQETAKDDDVYEMPVGELCKGFCVTPMDQDIDDENAFINIFLHFPQT